MEDELKPVVPSRYTITVPAAQIERLGEAREEWERGLAEYFMEVLRSNRWSAIGQPRVTIAYDPALTGIQVQVAVEEPNLIHNGGTIPRRKHRAAMIVAFVGVLLICIAVLMAVTRPGPWGNRADTPGKQSETSSTGHGLPFLSWWNDTSRGILGIAGGKTSAEVDSSPCFVVRAGSPSNSVATRQSNCIPVVPSSTRVMARWLAAST